MDVMMAAAMEEMDVIKKIIFKRVFILAVICISAFGTMGFALQLGIQMDRVPSAIPQIEPILDTT